MRANQFIKELSYPGNIGMMELMQFQKVATPEEKTRMKLLLSTDKKAAWNFLQRVVGTNLHPMPLEEEVLYEIDMSPGNLKRLAAETGAMAGMEFEMIVPGVEDVDEGDLEPNFSSDDRVSSIEGIQDFFADGDYNSRREVDRLIETIYEDYYNWVSDRRYEEWSDERDEFFRDEMKDEFDFDEARESAAEELGLSADSDEVSQRVEEMFDEFVEKEWDREGRLYQNAYDNWVENTELPDVTEFFSDRGWRWMSDVYNEYAGDINWPYYTVRSEGKQSFEALGEEYSEMIGRPVNVSTKYHGAQRKPRQYSLEPDSSISPDSEGGSGAEFVSPPLPLDEMIDDLKNTIEWAKKKGAYTNQSTGLHMNISIPGKNTTYLDFTKLALLLGDKYVLEQFGREANRYTESALGKIQSRIRQNPELATSMMDQMRKGMNALASRAIANSEGFGKYTSINPKDGYVEFRSPGGDWMNTDINALTSTLQRFVVALDAALDPEKYRKEYLKKLYQILQPKSNNDPIAYFAQYSAGLLPKSALKSFVKNLQSERRYQKDVAKLATTQAYKVHPKARPGAEIFVRVNPGEDVFLKAQELRPDIFGSLSRDDVEIISD